MDPLKFNLLVSMAARGPISPVASFFQFSGLAQSSKSDLKDFSASIKYYVEGKEGEAVELIVDKGVAKSAGRIGSPKRFKGSPGGKG